MPTQERVEQNERLFRDVNDRIADVTAHVLSAGEGDADFYCECARRSCLERIRLTLVEYRTIRAHPRHFVLVEGHELPEHETVVRRGDGWAVVEKPDLSAA